MTQRLFITATDTGAGKTYVTAALARLLHRMQVDAVALKPVASGLDDHGHNEDIDALLAAQTLDDADAINLYRLQLAAAPMVAAAAEGRLIDLPRLTTWCDEKSRGHEITLIEGVGGLMVPLAPKLLVSDWLQSTPAAEVALVIGARLGCMNHALLTLAQLQRMQRTPAWVIFNDLTNDGMAEQCEEAIRPWLSPTCRTLQLPYESEAGESLLPLAEALLSS